MSNTMISKGQLSKLHVLLNQQNLIAYKREIISEFTNGRTTSSREMTTSEAKYLISKLAEISPLERQKKAIWHLARRCGIIYGYTKDDNMMNAAKLDKFLNEKGTVKKALQKMNFEELKKTHKQFEGIVQNKHKTENNRNAREKTKALLTELCITVK